jgi:hypothetical protein
MLRTRVCIRICMWVHEGWRVSHFSHTTPNERSSFRHSPGGRPLVVAQGSSRLTVIDARNSAAVGLSATVHELPLIQPPKEVGGVPTNCGERRAQFEHSNMQTRNMVPSFRFLKRAIINDPCTMRIDQSEAHHDKWNLR